MKRDWKVLSGKAASKSDRASEILNRLRSEYPGTVQQLCALKFRTSFQLLVATILSAQCTDERVNMTTPKLFEKFPSPEQMAEGDIHVIEKLVYSTGFYKNKAKNILEMSRTLLISHEGEVPDNIDELSALPGVGRKTANVVLSVAFSKPGLPVDTHVGRLSLRLGLTASKDPVKVEHELMSIIPPAESGGFSLRLILHGRRVCIARRPKCEQCVLVDLCPSAFSVGL